MNLKDVGNVIFYDVSDNSCCCVSATDSNKLITFKVESLFEQLNFENIDYYLEVDEDEDVYRIFHCCDLDVNALEKYNRHLQLFHTSAQKTICGGCRSNVYLFINLMITKLMLLKNFIIW